MHFNFFNKKFFKLFFLLLLVLFGMWEFARENNYLFNRILTIPYYYRGTIEDNHIAVQGNYRTTAINAGDTYSAPRVASVECNISQRYCIESGLQDVLGAYMPYVFKFQILT